MFKNFAKFTENTLQPAIFLKKTPVLPKIFPPKIRTLRKLFTAQLLSISGVLNLAKLVELLKKKVGLGYA